MARFLSFTYASVALLAPASVWAASSSVEVRMQALEELRRQTEISAPVITPAIIAPEENLEPISLFEAPAPEIPVFEPAPTVEEPVINVPAPEIKSEPLYEAPEAVVAPLPPLPTEGEARVSLESLEATAEVPWMPVEQPEVEIVAMPEELPEHEEETAAPKKTVLGTMKGWFTKKKTAEIPAAEAPEQEDPFMELEKLERIEVGSVDGVLADVDAYEKQQEVLLAPIKKPANFAARRVAFVPKPVVKSTAAPEKTPEIVLPAKSEVPDAKVAKAPAAKPEIATKTIEKNTEKPITVAKKAEKKTEQVKPAEAKPAPKTSLVAKVTPSVKEAIQPPAPPQKIEKKVEKTAPITVASIAPEPAKSVEQEQTTALPKGALLKITFDGDTAAINNVSKNAIAAFVKQQKASDKRYKIVSYAIGHSSRTNIARRVALQRAIALRSQLMQAGLDSIRINVQAAGNKFANLEKGDYALIYHAN